MSWTSAASAAIAIFPSKRSQMYNVTRTRKMITASMALLVMSAPQDGPIWSSCTSLTDTPAIWASAVVTLLTVATSPVSLAAASTLMVRLPVSVLVRSWTTDWAIVGPTAPMAARASATDFSVCTCQTVPPLKSMEKLSPRTPREMTPARMMIPEMANQRRHRPAKSKEVSPRNRRRKALVRLPTQASLGVVRAPRPRDMPR